MMRRILQVIFAVLMGLVPGMASADNVPPLPSSINVMAPSADTPSDLIGFLGVWTGGVWGNTMPHALVVERVGNDEASVIYSRGAAPIWGVPESAWWRTTATVDREKKQLVIKLPSGGVISYWLTTGGLGAVYSREWATTHVLTYHAELKRFNPWEASAPPPLPKDLQIVVQEGDAKRFACMWRGIWSHMTPHVFVVERIEGAIAKVVYSHGTNSHLKLNTPKWHRFDAKYDANLGKIVTTFPTGAVATYTLDVDGSLSGEFVTPRGAKLYGKFSPQCEMVSKPRS